MSKKIILILASAIIVFTSSASLFSGDKNSPARSESDTLNRKKFIRSLMSQRLLILNIQILRLIADHINMAI